MCEKEAEELTYTLKDEEGNIIGQGDLTGKEGRITLAKEYKKLEKETTYTYTLEIEFVETNKDQNHNAKAEFNGEVEVDLTKIIIIDSINDLVALSNSVNNGNTYEGMYIKLAKDLDFQSDEDYEDTSIKNAQISGSGFIPIGTTGQPFKGTFDGNNNRIDNLYMNNKINDVIGLFGLIDESTISNLTVTGEIVGEAGKNMNAGLIGATFNSKMENLTSYLNVTSNASGWSVGGIVGSAHVGANIISNCTNHGNISNGNNTGGIVGIVESNTTLTIENSHNEGEITNNLGQYAGGLVGRDNANTSKVIIKNSYNKGKINVDNNANSTNVGGLMGYVHGTITIENSNNEGIITINSNTVLNIGGLVGVVTGQANINNSHNRNTITSNKVDNVGTRRIGGLVGLFSSTLTSTITNSSNEEEGVINGGTRTGGLVGEAKSGLIINNCYNLASINSSDTWSSSIYIGGLFGSINGWDQIHEDIVILNSYNKGNIEVNVDNYAFYASGLVGQQEGSTSTSGTGTPTNTKIINSYNQGNITMKGTTTGVLRAAGILSFGLKSVTLNNIYNIGSLNSIKDNYIVGFKNGNPVTNFKNVYYLDTLKGILPDDTTNVISKSASEMQNINFINTLNENIKSINLSDIDSRLSNYSLCSWQLGTSGYPELACNN